MASAARACLVHFGAIRSSIVANVPGRISALMERVLHVFCSPSGHDFSVGGGLFCRPTGEDTIVKGEVGGFFGDELGLKEALGAKAQAARSRASHAITW